MRNTLTLGSAAVAGAGALALVLASPGAGQADGTTSSAYGFSASGEVQAEPMPYVESTDGSEQSNSAFTLPENPLLAVSAAEVRAANRTASAKLTGIELGRGVLAEVPDVPQELLDACQNLPGDEAEAPELPDVELPGLPPIDPGTLPADDLEELCSLLLTPPDSLAGIDLLEVSCEGDTGTVHIVGATLGATTIDTPDPAPNTQPFPANPLIKVTANRQTRNADGTLTVDGLVVSLGGAQGGEEIVLGSVTCGAAADAGGTPPVEEAPPAADPPTPVPADVPVTG